MIFAEVVLLDSWLQLLMQGGALGLLGYIIVMLAPKLIKDARDEREHRDEHFQTMLAAMHDRFEARNLLIVGTIEKQTKELSVELKAVTAAVQTACKGVAHG